MREALLIIDIQPDFLPGGALGVEGGDRTLPVINAHLRRADLAFATADYHPSDHGSFASAHPGKKPGDVVDLNGIAQVLWPDHCVQRTPGAMLSEKLERQHLRGLVYKGTRSHIDSYSGFFENDRRTATGLHEVLQALKVEKLLIMGIATDYCVRATVMDALALGYKVRVDASGCAGVNLSPGDADHALMEMESAGAEVFRSLDDAT